ncbi:MAG: radical SAM protein [Desulfobacteraceae bacterium]|nr:MAG: radical SAM protein [Desulfobacteraceae bacterium]
MKKIAIINPLEKYFDRMSRLFIMPRYGTVAVGSALKRAGYEVRIFSEFIRAAIDWEYVYHSDYICFALMSFCSWRGYELAQQIRKKTKAPIIFGGAHPTVLPEECLNYCDYVVRNEGEETVVELIDSLENGTDVHSIKGISYRNASGRPVHNPNREFMENIDIPYDLTLLNEYAEVGQRPYGKRPAVSLQVLQTSRGCPFNCKFCVAPRELGTRYRTKSIATVLTDIENSMSVTKSNTFMIVDNEFTVNRKRTEKLLRAIIDRYGRTLNVALFARTEIGKDKHTLDLMKQAGVTLIYVGVESVNEDTLKFYNKKQTIAEVTENIAGIHASGIYTFGSTILGSDYDTPEKIRNTADFFIQNNFLHANFYSLYEIPTKERVLGIPQLFPDNRFIHYDWRFYNSAFVIHYPKYMKPSTLQKIIIENYEKFYSLKDKSRIDPLKGSLHGRVSFKLHMVKPEMEVARRYIPFLEKLEDGLYDEREHLLESRLPSDFEKIEFYKEIPVDLSGLD